MDWKILLKYVQNDCDEEDLRKLGAWLQQNPANEDFFSSFVEEWNGNEAANLNTDAQVAWNKFKSRTLKDNRAVSPLEPSTKARVCTTRKPSQPVQTKRRRYDIGYWTYAAAASMLLVFVLMFIIQHFNPPGNQIQEEQQTYQEISTVRGQRTNLRLSDGTKVILNSTSRLRIPSDYGKGTRTLYLEGEAFFEVEHDAENPFIVISNQTYTQDLGTQFNVRAYDSARVEVAVKEGLVSMGKVESDSLPKKMVRLTPNKLGRLSETGEVTVSEIQEMDRHMGWTEGKLIFRSTSFPEVMKRLEQWFDIDCKVEDNVTRISERTLTATYDDMPLSEVLNVLSISMNVSYTRQGRTVTFY